LILNIIVNDFHHICAFKTLLLLCLSSTSLHTMIPYVKNIL